jgi:hypothetical protein
MRKVQRSLIASLMFALLTASGHSAALNELALEVPADGGGMLMYSRTWRVARYLHAGFVAGGGQINRDFDLESPGQPNLQAETKTLVLPMIGPRITLVFPVIAISVGYAAFWGRTDLDVDVPGAGRLSGETSGWGTGFYSPLLSVDVYSEKRDMTFGIGLGGFFGTSFPDLTASGGGISLRTTENPIDTLSLHLKMGWADGRQARRERKESLDDF